MNEAKIMILDSNTFVVEGLGYQINSENGKSVIGLAKKPGLGIKMAKIIKPDILLAEPNISGMGGLDLINALLSDNPLLKIILVTEDTNVSNVINYFKKGIFGYVSKFCSYGELLFAIDSVIHNKQYIEQDMLIKMDAANFPVKDFIKNLSCSYDLHRKKAV